MRVCIDEVEGIAVRKVGRGGGGQGPPVSHSPVLIRASENAVGGTKRREIFPEERAPTNSNCRYFEASPRGGLRIWTNWPIPMHLGTLLYFSGPGRNYRITSGYLRRYLIFVVGRGSRVSGIFIGSVPPFRASPTIRQKPTAICLSFDKEESISRWEVGLIFSNVETEISSEGTGESESSKIVREINAKHCQSTELYFQL